MTATRPQPDDAFLALFEEHFDYVCRTLRRLGCAASDLEDLAQEVFLAVYRGRDRYDPSRPMRPWLFGIARNVARAHRRRKRPESPLVDRDGRKSDPGYRAFESADLVYAALATLDEPLREVLVLRDLEQLPPDRVAERLGLPVATVFDRLRRARDAFRRAARRLHGGPVDA